MPKSQTAEPSPGTLRKEPHDEPLERCPDDAGQPAAREDRWIGAGAAPNERWWEALVEQEARPRARPAFPRVAAPRVALEIHGLVDSSPVRRAYRQSVGRYRVCHEAALSRQSTSPTNTAQGTVNGYWVARTVHGSGGSVCSVEVVHTTLPDELSRCLRGAVLEQHPVGGEPGKLELVLTFYEP